MKHNGNSVENIKIAYIGGGSRGWGWGLMSDLAAAEDISGDVYLYDIDFEAAQSNEIIGNKYNTLKDTKSKWNYHAVDNPKSAYENADFVVISILPGTFDEMESDVHTPEKYGIYQSVGDTSGPGGIVRAMRTIPMYEYIAECIKTYCPDAWVINYTNPMTLCVKTLYRVFPEIKAFGCCHEVFGTQKFLARIIGGRLGIENIKREDIKVNPVAVNHFTWLTSAKYKNIDIYPYYKEYCDAHPNGTGEDLVDSNWANGGFKSQEKVKMDLFKRFGIIAAAGDRHLAEFCEGKWYLESPERVDEMLFGLTSVKWRKNQLKELLAKSSRLKNGEEDIVISETGEEGVNQIRALLGLEDLITNVNIPNRGQIPNLPLGAVVESNAIFRDNELAPVMAGEVPAAILSLVSRICAEQEQVSSAIANRDVKAIFAAFMNDPLVTCPPDEAKALFKEMCENTKEYLDTYDLTVLD